VEVPEKTSQVFHRKPYPRCSTDGSRSTLHSVGENEDVLVTVDRGFGLIRLNRPRAINSLTPTMVSAISQALTEWEHDDDISAVVLSGEGERGLCAGGDIVDVVYKSALGDHSIATSFWWDEYLMNAQIAGYSKPFVSLMDGIVMGGGVGVSAHGSVRVVALERDCLVEPILIESRGGLRAVDDAQRSFHRISIECQEILAGFGLPVLAAFADHDAIGDSADAQSR